MGVAAVWQSENVLRNGVYFRKWLSGTELRYELVYIGYDLPWPPRKALVPRGSRLEKAP